MLPDALPRRPPSLGLLFPGKKISYKKPNEAQCVAEFWALGLEDVKFTGHFELFDLGQLMLTDQSSTL